MIAYPLVELTKREHETIVFPHERRGVWQLEGIVLQAEQAQHAVGNLECKRATARPRGIEQIYEFLVFYCRRHRNPREIDTGKTAAYPTGSRDRAGDSEA